MTADKRNDLSFVDVTAPQMNLSRFYTGRVQGDDGRWHHAVLDRETEKAVELAFGPAEAGARAKVLNADLEHDANRENTLDLEQPGLTRGGLY